MNSDFIIRTLSDSEIKSALELVWRTFEEFEAPDYSFEGTEHFKAFIKYDTFKKNIESLVMTIYGCFFNAKLIGVIALRGYSHISLLFVDKSFHRKGAATLLFRFAAEKCRKNLPEAEDMTVNSSPYAAGFYHFVGFKDTSAEQTTDDIRYIPMKCKL